MSMLLFLRSHPKFDVAILPEQLDYIEDDKPKKKKRKKRKTYSVRNRERSTVAREINAAAAAKTYIEETIRKLEREDLQRKRERQLQDVMTIMELLDFLDDGDL